MAGLARLVALLAMLAGAAAPALAQAPGGSPLPPPRPQAPAAKPTAPRQAVAPAPRAVTAVLATPASPAVPAYPAEAPPRPGERAPLIRQNVRGLCSDPRLEGKLLDPIEAPGRCGIPLPVSITAVAGVKLSPPAIVNCRTARTLASWVERGPGRAAPRLMGAQLAEMRIAGSYSCRNRNFDPNARLSEHSAGNAVDISILKLTDGREIDLAGNWRKGAAGEWLLGAWRAACGPFGTVLGPDHNALHHDHFHLDTASRTFGAYCR